MLLVLLDFFSKYVIFAASCSFFEKMSFLRLSCIFFSKEIDVISAVFYFFTNFCDKPWTNGIFILKIAIFDCLCFEILNFRQVLPFFISYPCQCLIWWDFGTKWRFVYPPIAVALVFSLLIEFTSFSYFFLINISFVQDLSRNVIRFVAFWNFFFSKDVSLAASSVRI